MGIREVSRKVAKTQRRERGRTAEMRKIERKFFKERSLKGTNSIASGETRRQGINDGPLPEGEQPSTT
jgi:L-fucose mutarotase/ribose pyranase (RbsD/FucU family)